MSYLAKKNQFGTLDAAITVDTGCSVLSIDDSAVDYTVGAPSVTDPIKKVLVARNPIMSGQVQDELTFDSPPTELSQTSWQQYGFEDGWHTVYVLALEKFPSSLTATEMDKGFIFHYTSGGSSTKPTGFYVSTQSQLYSGTIPINSTLFATPTYADWVNFIDLIQSRVDNADFPGDYTVFQQLIICELDRYVIDIALELVGCQCCAPECEKCSGLCEYERLKLKVEAAKNFFCRDAYEKSQELVQSAYELYDELKDKDFGPCNC